MSNDEKGKVEAKALPELLSESEVARLVHECCTARLVDLGRKPCYYAEEEKFCPPSCDRGETFERGIRAVMKKLGVVTLVECGPGAIRRGCEPGEHLAWLVEGGAILVRVKEENERG